MSNYVAAPLVLDGWFVLHQFFRIDRFSPGLDDSARALTDLLARWEELGEGGWSGLYRIVGGETDVMLMHFRPTLEALGEVEREVQRSPAAAALVPTGDYLSVVELGMYGATAALLREAEEAGVTPDSAEWDAMTAAYLEAERGKRYVDERLHPRQPDDMPYVCFYPMDKRRAPDQNWYTLTLPERAALMVDHGSTGRQYAGRISQIISGSVGFDDWEWAVTLFAVDPLDFKALVTEMRYDNVSSVYAEFGSFRVGHRIATEDAEEELLG